MIHSRPCQNPFVTKVARTRRRKSQQLQEIREVGFWIHEVVLLTHSDQSENKSIIASMRVFYVSTDNEHDGHILPPCHVPFYGKATSFHFIYFPLYMLYANFSLFFLVRSFLRLLFFFFCYWSC